MINFVTVVETVIVGKLTSVVIPIAIWVAVTVAVLVVVVVGGFAFKRHEQADDTRADLEVVPCCEHSEA